MEIEIKYFTPHITKIETIQKGSWIDLRTANYYTLHAGDFTLLKLGVGMRLPVGYEAVIAPRSSTFKEWGILQANGIGVIDGYATDENGNIILGTGYCGDNDQWRMPVFATRDVVIPRDTRICQFRIQEKQPDITFKEVAKLDDVDRGGFGSTGTR